MLLARIHYGLIATPPWAARADIFWSAGHTTTWAVLPLLLIACAPGNLSLDYLPDPPPFRTGATAAQEGAMPAAAGLRSS